MSLSARRALEGIGVVLSVNGALLLRLFLWLAPEKCPFRTEDQRQGANGLGTGRKRCGAFWPLHDMAWEPSERAVAADRYYCDGQPVSARTGPALRTPPINPAAVPETWPAPQFCSFGSEGSPTWAVLPRVGEP